jgi:2'-5' RNA ligase
VKLFAAIFPPQDAVARISALQDRLRPVLTSRSSWVRPEQLHITLRFFGDIASDVALSQVLDGIDGIAQFSITLDRVGGFPSGHRARVLFCESSDCPQLVELSSRLGEDSDHPHLTLARFKVYESLPVRDVDPIRFTASDVVLVNSVQASGAHSYEIVQRWRLT